MRSFLTLFTLFLCSTGYAQKLDWQKEVDKEQLRLDLSDGQQDQMLHLGSKRQDQIASSIFFQKVDLIQEELKKLPGNDEQIYARGLFEYLKKIELSDIPHLSAQSKAMELIHKLVTLNNPKQELELLKTDLKTGIRLSDIINLKTYAVEYWTYAAGFYPTDVLSLFKNLAYTPVGTQVVIALCRIDPGAIKQYFGSNMLIDRVVKNSTDSIATLLYSIFKQYGTRSKSYALIELIEHQGMSLEKAEKISSNPVKFYKTLIDLRKTGHVLADYTVEKELEALSMERVVEVNLRHEEKDTVRFAPIQSDHAIEIYTSIVYCPQEIFTSTFLGMYKRMMYKRKQRSGYEFLKTAGFNRFRVFLKQCAGYNQLDDFLGTMNDSQANAIISMFAGDLYNYGGDLGPAVDVADTYGSLENPKLKALFSKMIEKEYRLCVLKSNAHGIKIYGLLLKLTGGSPESISAAYQFNIPDLDRISSAELFPDSTHIQQHFFFDDEDGETAFNHWLNLYPSSVYKKTDKGSYILIQSISGAKMEIYGNKPGMEFEGRKAIRQVFEKRNRYPDLIVHRGHSYYIENTINNMTNSNKIALLGSCGGYQNISKAMENAFEVQIISTKQVGTLAVNSVLIQEITETIRSGKDLIWPELWSRVEKKLKDNAQFKDYIPPYKNLGARFIKAYNELVI